MWMEKCTHMCDLSMHSFLVSTSSKWLCKLTEQPVQKATMTVCACLTALLHIPVGDYVQLKKRSWSLLTEAKGDSYTKEYFQEEAEKYYLCYLQCNACWEPKRCTLKSQSRVIRIQLTVCYNRGMQHAWQRCVVSPSMETCCVYVCSDTIPALNIHLK